MKVVETELEYERACYYPFEMYAEYEDGYSCYVYDRDEECAMSEIGFQQVKHGTCTFYTGVNNEDRTDGKWIGRENYIYE